MGDIIFLLEYLLEDWMRKKKNNLGKDYKTIVYTYIYFCGNYLGKVSKGYTRLREFIDFE